MRVYMGNCGRGDLRKARQTAPSHVFGHCWTPQHKGLETVPYIVDNGAYVAAQNSEPWDLDAWLELLDRMSEFSYGPDFVVLPDEYNDAEGTIEKHRQYAPEVLDRGLPPAAVVQPGMDVATQVRLADRIGAEFVFVGGENRWKRAYGHEIVENAHELGLKVHIGNPGGKDGLEWSYKIGADSADTSSVVQNQFWHYLEKLEKVSLKEGVRKKRSSQSTLLAATDGVNARSVNSETEQQEGDDD